MEEKNIPTMIALTVAKSLGIKPPDLVKAIVTGTGMVEYLKEFNQCLHDEIEKLTPTQKPS